MKFPLPFTCHCWVVNLAGMRTRWTIVLLQQIILSFPHPSYFPHPTLPYLFPCRFPPQFSSGFGHFWCFLPLQITKVTEKLCSQLCLWHDAASLLQEGMTGEVLLILRRLRPGCAEFLHRNNELIQLAQNCCVGMEKAQERWNLWRI